MVSGRGIVLVNNCYCSADAFGIILWHWLNVVDFVLHNFSS